MPDEIVEKQQDNRTTTQEQTLSVLLQKVMGADNGPDLTKEQVDEVLSQRRRLWWLWSWEKTIVFYLS